jgi:thiamine biosynthesis protein ThiS
MTPPSTAAATIALTVNGEPRSLAAGTTLAGLLAFHDLDPRLVVVELNGTIRRDKDAFAATALADGDVVELVHFVGGG